MAKKKTKNSIIAFIMIGAGLLYLTNLTLGVFELIPDNLPYVGNIDEGVAGGLIWEGWQILKNA